MNFLNMRIHEIIHFTKNTYKENKTTKQQNNKTTKQQNNKTTKQQNNKTTNQ